MTIGIANLLSLGQAAFYGIGAYISAFFLMQFNLPLIIVALSVMLITGLFSYMASFASAKLKGDYFVLATLGFQMIIYTILYNWIDVTRGPYGLSGIPPIRFAGVWKIQGIYGYFFLTVINAVCVALIFKTIKFSPYGRVLRALRHDEVSVAAMGRNPVSFKSWALFLSAAFSGLAGLMYASYVSYIDPTSFTLDESIFIICALFIGGTGNIRGPILGALFVVILPELLRFLGLPSAIAANMRQIIYGIALVVVMYYRPQGLWGETKMK